MSARPHIVGHVIRRATGQEAVRALGIHSRPEQAVILLDATINDTYCGSPRVGGPNDNRWRGCLALRAGELGQVDIFGLYDLEQVRIVENEVFQTPADNLDTDGEAVGKRSLDRLIVEDIKNCAAVAGYEMFDFTFARDANRIPPAVGFVPVDSPFQLAPRQSASDSRVVAVEGAGISRIPRQTTPMSQM